jgi:hypothetical protein
MGFQSLRLLGSPGLLLGADDFRYNGHHCAWADIEKFSAKGARHVKVEFTPGANLNRAIRTSVTLGRFGFYTAPAYIPLVSFDTEGVPLRSILQNWLWSYRLGRWDGDDGPGGPAG